MSSLEDACVLLYGNRLRRASRAPGGRPAQGRKGLKAYDHSRSMATFTGPDVRKCVWGGRHVEQATHAIRHCNQNTYADKHKGDTMEGKGVCVDQDDETSGGSAQDMSEQGSTGDWKRVDQPERVAVGHRPTSGRLAT